VIPEWIPRRKLSVVGGEGSAGKTQLLCGLAVRVIDGGRMPNGSILEPGGRVLYFDAENGDDSIRGKLRLNGLKNFKNFGYHSMMTPSGEFDHLDLTKHTPLWRRIVDGFQPDWVIVDPLVAFHDKKEIDPVQMRAVANTQLAIAYKHNCAWTFIQHPNKDREAKGVYKFRGSGDIVWAVRAAMEVSWDEESGTTRKVAMLKDNDSINPPDPLYFTIDPTKGIVFLEESIPIDSDSPGQRGKAVLFLQAVLHDTPRTSNELQSLAYQEKLAWRTVRRAAKDMGIEVKKAGTRWVYILPNDQKPYPLPNLANLIPNSQNYVKSD